LTETYSWRISKENGVLLLSVYDQLQQPVEDYICTRVKDETTMKQKKLVKLIKQAIPFPFSHKASNSFS
jgi:hypothetical protein